MTTMVQNSWVTLDEFKFIMTTAVINQLATIRDFKTTLMVNFQSFTNFETSPNKAMSNVPIGAGNKTTRPALNQAAIAEPSPTAIAKSC